MVARYIQNNAIPGAEESLMNIVAIESPIGLDRLATRDEVRCALSFSSRRVLESIPTRDDVSEMDSDFGGGACDDPEDISWSAIVRELRDSISN
jgi:hypothetical protein